jgi:hypothetical protein
MTAVALDRGGLLSGLSSTDHKRVAVRIAVAAVVFFASSRCTARR